MTTTRWISTDELPADIFHGYAYMTGTCVEFAPDGDGYSETDGWVDPSWSRHELEESRNNVRPVATWSRVDDVEDGETVAASFRRWMSETVDEWLSAPRDNADGTVYGEGEETDSQGRSWTYALHFTASHHMMRRPDVEFRVTAS